MDGELMERVTSLRAAIARMRTDLDAVLAAEQELTEKLRALGIDDAITTVDLPTIAGLPSRRKNKDAATPARETSTLKAAAVGAGLMLGVALVVLLSLNLVTRGGATAVASAASSVPTPVAVPTPSVAPPPPIVSVAPVVSAAPSVEPKPPPEMGALTILCTPRCDAITDNGAPLSPGNLVGVPVVAGPHRIEARGNGMKRSYSVNVAPNETREVKVTLEHVDRGF